MGKINTLSTCSKVCRKLEGHNLCYFPLPTVKQHFRNALYTLHPQGDTNLRAGKSFNSQFCLSFKDKVFWNRFQNFWRYKKQNKDMFLKIMDNVLWFINGFCTWNHFSMFGALSHKREIFYFFPVVMTVEQFCAFQISLGFNDLCDISGANDKGQ